MTTTTMTTTTAQTTAYIDLPAIQITTPTPPRISDATLYTAASRKTPTASTSTETKATSDTPTTKTTHSASYRLLYRGALSLPDSLLLLDGLTFAARLDSPSKPSHAPLSIHGTEGTPAKQSAFALLENPLALGLESMRGRPSLRFLEAIDLAELERKGEMWLDESGRVQMDIHPLAVLSKIYFENMFCLLPFGASSSTAKDPPLSRSNIGIKVALGDSDGPETTQIVIYAELSSASNSPQPIRLRVARLCPRPPPCPPTEKKKRIPRPDDPIPRKPPAFFVRELKRTGSLGVGSLAAGGMARELKRVASVGGGILGPPPAKKQKVGGDIAGLGSGVRLGKSGSVDESAFKVPELPSILKKGKGKEKEKEKDVFGDVAEVSSAVKAKESTSSNVKESNPEEVATEKANKSAIKRATTEYLGRTKDPTTGRLIDKAHPEFKDLLGIIYRGVLYALRAKIRSGNLDPGLVGRLVEGHALMYLGGHGGCWGTPAGAS
ncbi:unnamed protein product [Cyclocybe aegerita]|uniref:Sld7 C-terminal domain-containing protein n=1 Tax=Cyclocybe aegerita TaxID=1973307 RepID=A0A8S0XF45_CYCAE|nr:unnamed protein product [Cyclocybe aegerita]